MNRCRAVDGDLPLSAILYDDEQLVGSQDGVGLYDGKDKNPDFQNGTIHITTHRLLYIDHAKPRKYSLSLSLGLIKQTEYYAGFLKSSPKVILLLTNALDDNASTEAAPTPLESTGSGWICSVCSYSNPPSASGTRPKCVLCGVIQDPSMLPASSFAKSVPSSSSIPTQSQVMLAPQPQSKTAPIPCPTCTFLNHPSMRTCEICGTPLRSTSAPLPIPGRKSMQSLSTDVSPVGTPDPHGRDAESMIKISFRKGGDKTCYASLKRTLLGKAWEGERSQRKSSNTVGEAARSGIHGIMQSVDTNAKHTGENMQAAFQDLEAFMARAREMVQIAESLNKKIAAQEEQEARQRALFPDLPSSVSSTASLEPEEAKFVRSSLARLGLASAAITQDMAEDENRYHEELAKELGRVLTGENGKKDGLMSEEKGIIGLDEVWGSWNRARGVALIPPSSLLLALPYLPKYTQPTIRSRTLSSGLRVLHVPRFEHNVYAARVVSLITSLGPITTGEMAQQDGISIGLAKEMVESVEADGEIVRDQGGTSEEIKWFVNILKGYEWDGEADTGT